MRVIHWFRSDLRIEDNTAFAAACTRGSGLVPVFVLDDILLRRHRDAHPRLRFLRACLHALARELERKGSRLVVLNGDPRRRVPELARACRASLVTWNRDYGPYAKRRDGAVRRALERERIEVRTFKDRVVFEGDEIRTGKGGAYSVYTPYRRAWWRRYQGQPPPEELIPATLPPGVANGLPDELANGSREVLLGGPPGGTAAARARLDAFLGGPVRRYHVDRNYPAIAGTSRLSPWLRFGALSVRACIRDGLTLARAEPGAAEGVSRWLDELVWREFYHAILDSHPQVLDGPWRNELSALEWDERPDYLEAWQAGMTGFPIVDAGMRELAQSGWMHNRARMVAASFLAKDLHIDWRAGENWFMRRLVDGDPASNNGGWQWAASTGTDAQPYFRIFNPTVQGERFDPNGDYVRRWVPELAGLRGAAAHRPQEAPGELRGGYPAPLVDHARERGVALSRYRAARAARE